MVCLPLRITNEEKEDDGRLGGAPPQGIGVEAADLRYFATVPFAESDHLSIFVADYDELAENRAVVSALGLVQVVLHSPAQRDNAADGASLLSAQGLAVLPEAEDWMEDDGQRLILSGHKIGGRPYLIRNTPELVDGIENARQQGFRQMLQIDFPEATDADISGPWPFGDGIFNLFGRPPFGAQDWKWYWDF